MPKVTVGLAVYNDAATLPAALESVRAQSFTDYELLVIDDGSTDGSGDIAAEFGARVVRQENAGLGAGRKRMVEEATGDWIAFIDADDEWLPKKLDRQMAALESSSAVLIHSDCRTLYEGGREITRGVRIDPPASAFDHIVPDNKIVASSAVFARRAMIEAGNFVADTVRCSDWYGWFVLAPHGEFLYLPEELVRYRVRAASLANAGFRFHDGQRHVLEDKILPRFDELFASVRTERGERYRGLLQTSLGVALSSMAKHLGAQGERAEARALHRRAARLAPGVLRVWTRMLRSYLPL